MRRLGVSSVSHSHFPAPGFLRHLSGLLLSRGPSLASDSSAHTFRALDEAAVIAADIRRAELQGKHPEQPKGEGSNNSRGVSASSRPWELAMHDALASTAADLSAVWRRSEPGAALAAPHGARPARGRRALPPWASPPRRGGDPC